MKNETPIQGHYDTSSVFVAVIGRPNVGKSSLTNLLVGEKVAIVTSKPQTTRTRITGVITRGPLQYVLLDTPGVHKPHNKLGKRMDKTASDSIADVDVSMMLFEPYGALNESEMVLVEALKKGGPAIADIDVQRLRYQRQRNGSFHQMPAGKRKPAFVSDTPVAEAALPLIHRMDPQGQALQQAAEEGQSIRQQHQIGSPPAVHQDLPVQVSHGSQGQGEHQRQQPDMTDHPGGNLRIKHAEEQHGYPIKAHHHPLDGLEGIAGHADAEVQAQHPDGNGGLVEPLLAVQQDDEGIEQGGCHRQNDLAPHVLRLSGPFHTGERNAGHCRADHAHGHQPGQQVFPADVEMISFFHNSAIIPDFPRLCNEKIPPGQPGG